MIEIEIINATLDSSLVGPRDTSKNNFPDPFCVIKLFGKEIASTASCNNTLEPIWNERFPRNHDDINLKETINNRPFFLEYFDVEIRDQSRQGPGNGNEKYLKLCETKIPLTNIGNFKCYKLTKPCSDNKDKDNELSEVGRLFIRINRLENKIFELFSRFDFFQLCEIFPKSSPLYRHLYIDFNWSPDAFSYNGGLPGPLSGELVIDQHLFVEVVAPPFFILLNLFLMNLIVADPVRQ
jgi:hypothetical protein